MNRGYYYDLHFITEENRVPEEVNNFPEVTEARSVETRVDAEAV